MYLEDIAADGAGGFAAGGKPFVLKQKQMQKLKQTLLKAK